MKNIWFIGILALVVVGVGAMIFARNSSAPLPGNSIENANIEIESIDHIKGNLDAKITLVEFSDFQCPACKTYSTAIKAVLDAFPEDVKLVYKHFPLESIHPNARDAAKASEAAALQDAFWQMHDVLYEKQSEWSRNSDAKSLFNSYAKSLGLNTEKFETDMNSDAVAERVQKDIDLSKSLNLNSTPTFYLNNKKFANPRSVEEFINRIGDELKNLE